MTKVGPCEAYESPKRTFWNALQEGKNLHTMCIGINLINERIQHTKFYGEMITVLMIMK